MSGLYCYMGLAAACHNSSACFNEDCFYSHPTGLCSRWNQCTTYECQDRHGKERVRKCINGIKCSRFDCIFLHPEDWRVDLWTVGTSVVVPKAAEEFQGKTVLQSKKNQSMWPAKSSRKLSKIGEIGDRIITPNAAVSGVIWRHPGLKTDGKKACGVCELRKDKKQFKSWRWRAYNADLSICNPCAKTMPYGGQEKRCREPSAAKVIREWVINCKLGKDIIFEAPKLDLGYGMSKSEMRECRICEEFRNQAQFAKWRWKAVDSDLNSDFGVCNRCAKSMPFSGQEKLCKAPEAAKMIRDWVIQSKKELGLDLESDMDEDEEDEDDEDEDGQGGVEAEAFAAVEAAAAAAEREEERRRARKERFNL